MDRSDAPFRKIAEALRKQIQSGELKPGERVPSARDLAQRWGVARGTVDRALRQLREEGLVEVTAGRAGTVVAKDGVVTHLLLAVDAGHVIEVEAVEVVKLDAAQAAAIGVAPGSGLLRISMRSS